MKVEVRKIPKKSVTLLEPKRSMIVDKEKYRQRRVAAYCRVSTDSEEQLTSYTTQKRVYTEMIAASINEKTLLILDEPEAHLHPSWQNKLAEIIVLLMKQIGIKILITSHSPNFILALQTYSIKYKVEQECNFYTTQKKEDNYIIDYKRMNDELTKIYADFAIPFSQIKAIYDALSNGENYD